MEFQPFLCLQRKHEEKVRITLERFQTEGKKSRFKRKIDDLI